jgi:hypothetical protein
MRGSFQIGPDDFEQLLRRLGIKRLRIFVGIDQVRTDMVFDHFGHKAGQRTPSSGNQMQELITTCATIECALDRFDLPPDATDARQELLFFMNCM